MSLRQCVVLFAALSAACASRAAAQTTLVTFEQLFNGQSLPPGTPVDADGYPGNGHYLVDDYGLVGDPLGIVLNVGGSQSNYLRLTGGARFSFNRPIGIIGVTFDALPDVNPGYLELAGSLFALAPIFATTSGTLATPTGPWDYTVSQNVSGYYHFVGNGVILAPPNGGKRFGLIGDWALQIDNVQVQAFPEPASAAMAWAGAVGLVALGRKRRVA